MSKTRIPAQLILITSVKIPCNVHKVSQLADALSPVNHIKVIPGLSVYKVILTTPVSVYKVIPTTPVRILYNVYEMRV